MTATYRLQLHPDFDFAAAERLVPYLARLGVSHLYLSPITEARAGSTHGYDVIDHNIVREALGGREGFDRLLHTAQEAGLSIVLDFVPNHAGVGPQNDYWQDTLAYGPHSPYAKYFDIDWTPLKPELQEQVLLPFLGSPYGETLDGGEIALTHENGRLYATYYDHRYALSPATYADVLETVLLHYERTETYWDLRDLLVAYRSLKPSEREKAEALRLRFQTMAARVELSQRLEALDTAALHELLEQQYWRLSYWKTAGYEINYRRFFDINGLVGLRMEDAQVFWDAHRLLGDLLAQQGVAGVRIDHIDGLFDPHAYLRALRALGAGNIWVEKILAPGETLPEDWPVEGTTGYEFLNDVMGVLLQPEGELPLDRAYRRFVPKAEHFDEEVYQSKKLIIKTTLSSEFFRLAYELDRISEADYHTRDFTLEALREALAEVIAAFERYRTYQPYEQDEARTLIQRAVHRAQQRNPAFEPTVYSFIAAVILGDVREDLLREQRAWTGRFQQYTAPVAAKGVEDTAFYRYLRLVALNEVGGEPDRFGQTVQAFHSHAHFRAYRYPENLLATATHDHKRGEDTRMRLIALAEVPEQWEETAAALAHVADAHRGEHGPSPGDEYLFYQILAALWHDADRQSLPDRLWQYMEKASRESKRHTSWINQDPAYEADLEAFVKGMIADDATAEVLGPLAETLARYGFFNTLSQVVLKFTTPGVPDIYQGCELLDLSLVDPDNRRTVDYALRQQLLDQFQEAFEAPSPEFLQTLIDEQSEQAKFHLTARLLQLRHNHPDLFGGAYRALNADSDDPDHWIAYARTSEEQSLLVLVPRFPHTFPEHRRTRIPLPDEWARSTWTDVLTGAQVEADTALETRRLPLPWGVLLRN